MEMVRNIRNLETIQFDSVRISRDQIEAIRAPRFVAEPPVVESRLSTQGLTSPSLSKDPSTKVVSVYGTSNRPRPLPILGLPRKRKPMHLHESASLENAKGAAEGAAVGLPQGGVAGGREEWQRRMGKRRGLENRIIRKAEEEGMQDSIQVLKDYV